MVGLFPILLLLQTIQLNAQPVLQLEPVGYGELPTYGITSLWEQDEGFLWIGTVDGLVRYDGNHFQLHRPIPNDSLSISDGYVDHSTLVGDSSGFLWTMRGQYLSRLNLITGRWSRFSLDTEKSAQGKGLEGEALHVDKQGQLWIAHSGGVSKFDRQLNRVVSVIPDSVFGVLPEMSGIAEDSEGNLYFSGLGGIWSYDVGQQKLLKILPQSEALNATRWLSILIDSNENIWAGSASGEVVKINQERTLLAPIHRAENGGAGIQGDMILTFHEEADGKMLIGTYGSGVFYVSPGEFIYHSLPLFIGDTTFRGKQISDFERDQVGNLWIATWDEGLFKQAQESSFLTLSNEELFQASAPFSRIIGVTVHSGNRIWLAGGEGPLLFLDRGQGDLSFTVSRVDVPDSLFLRSVTGTAKSREWVGTVGQGILFRDDKTRAWTPLRDSSLSRLAGASVNQIFEDRQGLVWISTISDGVIVVDPVNMTVTQLNPAGEFDGPSAETEYWPIFEDRDGYLWIGSIGSGLYKLEVELTDNGLNIVNTDRYQHEPEAPNSLKSNSVLTINEDGMGRLWVGLQGGGIATLDKELNTFKHIDIDSSDPYQTVTCLLPDYRGHMWWASTNRLTRFNIEQATLTRFSSADGLLDGVFQYNACASTLDGTLVFGSTAGLTLYKPEAIVVDDFQPKVSIVEVELLDGPLKMDTVAVFKKTLELDHTQNDLTFRFASLDLTHPGENNYRYRILGIDDEWITTNLPFVTFRHLSPGTYTLEVQGTNHDDVWSENSAQLEFTIVPAVRDRLWFRMLIGMLVLLAVGSILWLRRQKNVEVIRTRQEIADDLHDDVGSNLSALLLFLERLQRIKALDERDRKRVAQFTSSTRQLVQYVRDTVWMIDASPDTVEDFVSRLEDTCRRLAHEINIRFTAPAIIPYGRLPISNRRHLYLIVREALTNAIRHAEATAINVIVTIEDLTITIQIIDDGVGFDTGEKKHGQGLKSLYRRSGLIKASLDIESALGEGTQVQIAYKYH